MDKGYLVQHVRVLPGGGEDIKIIGVYRSLASAEAAVERLRGKPGFHQSAQGFHIDAYVLDKDHWVEGFTSP
jgi:homoserine kinase type II